MLRVLTFRGTGGGTLESAFSGFANVSMLANCYNFYNSLICQFANFYDLCVLVDPASAEFSRTSANSPPPTPHPSPFAIWQSASLLAYGRCGRADAPSRRQLVARFAACTVCMMRTACTMRGATTAGAAVSRFANAPRCRCGVSGSAISENANRLICAMETFSKSANRKVWTYQAGCRAGGELANRTIRVFRTY